MLLLKVTYININNCEEMVAKKVNCKLKLILILSIFFPFTSSSEDLADVLRDAYNFYPDIEKSKTELKISEKDVNYF